MTSLKDAIAVPEATLEMVDGGLVPTSPGWFVVNVNDARANENEKDGTCVTFESRDNRFERFGINIQVLLPGQTNCMYHREPQIAQEAMLVLSGECILIVEGQERHLKSGDFFHCPNSTAHVFVGAGNGPCSILMVGTRDEWEGGGYPYEPAAFKHGASVREGEDTQDPAVAYAEWPESKPGRMTWPPER